MTEPKPKKDRSEYMRLWRIKNKEKCKEYSRKLNEKCVDLGVYKEKYANNRQYYLDKANKYYQDNAEKAKAREMTYREFRRAERNKSSLHNSASFLNIFNWVKK